MNKFLFSFLLTATALMQWSCTGTKKLADGEFLLKNNEIIIRKDSLQGSRFKPVEAFQDKINTEVFAKLADQLYPLLKQRPNRLLIWILPFHLTVYNLANKGKERKWKTWVKNTIGEAPVIYDSTLTRKTRDQFIYYLHNKGYFNAIVRDSVTLKKNKTAYVDYIVFPGKAYTIRSIQYTIKDKAVEPIILSGLKNSLIKTGANYDADALIRERERITAQLKDEGFYYFSKEYIYYDIDSSSNDLQLDVRMSVNRVNENNPDSAISPSSHQRYYVGDVYVQTDFNPRLTADTLVKDTVEYKNMAVVYSGKLMIKPEVLYRSIYVRKGDLYSGDNLDITYKLIGGLNIYKFSNIKFTEAKKDSAGRNTMDCNIKLTPAFRQSQSEEIDGTNTGGNFGVGGNIAYHNRNTFRGAEAFDFKISASVEDQRNSDLTNTGNSDIKALRVFNTEQISPEVSLTLPKFFVPWQAKVGRITKPKTTFASSYIYQQRPDYTRKVATLSYGYSWYETKEKRWILNPVDINLVYITNKSDTFQARLLKENPVIRHSYEDHFIPGGKYSFIYNAQDLAVKKSFLYYRLTLESAGNILRGVTQEYNKQKGDSTVWQFPRDVDFAEYLRPDGDIKYYHVLNPHNTLVYHAGAGVGFAFGNSHGMPFEKSFYGGGANDLRGWSIRSIGPGSFSNDSLSYERTGDIKITANIEYRFSLVKFFQGALFVDAGNIWERHRDAARPGAFLDLSNLKFLDNFGIDAGPGLRLDFGFFIIRVDYGIKLKDPGEPEGRKWVVTNTELGHLLAGKNYSALQFGIGYPF